MGSNSNFDCHSGELPYESIRSAKIERSGFLLFSVHCKKPLRSISDKLSPKRQEELACLFAQGQPLSEIIIAERERRDG